MVYMPVLGTLLLLGSGLLTAALFLLLARYLPLAEFASHSDSLGAVYSQVGVVYAVVLAMVVVGVWETRGRAHTNTYTETNAVLQLYWYGQSLPKSPRSAGPWITEL